MKDIRINFDDIKRNKLEKGLLKIRHIPGQRIKLLPYQSHFNKEVATEFIAIVAEFSRLTSNKVMNESYDQLLVINRMCEKIRFTNEEEKLNFKELARELFFNSNNEIEIFHPQIFNYVATSNKDHKNIAMFLYNTLWNKDIECVISNSYDFQPNNVMLKLFMDSLPKLNLKSKTGSKEREKFINGLKFVSQVFGEDFQFILEEPSLFVSSFEKILKYYYFFYTSQLTLKLNKLFNADYDFPEQLYFNLEWESMSKTRLSYKHGWNLLSTKIENLFSHVFCLDLLNHLTEEMPKPYLYLDFKREIELMSEGEKKLFLDDLDKLINLYKEHINDIEWSNFKCSDAYSEPIYNKINELFRTIDFQFNESSSNRKRVYERYSYWFDEYCKHSFLKRRGSLGYTLNISQEYLIFITRLCLKNQEKIKLKTLFMEYERRGLFFDRPSQEKIIQLFEKLNLLERKSDSGDAQYVKSIL